MSLLPARLQINDPAFRLGEKVQPKKAEPAPCPYAAFERGDKGASALESWEARLQHLYDDPPDALREYVLGLRGGCGCSWPNASPPCSRCTDPYTDEELEDFILHTTGDERPTALSRNLAAQSSDAQALSSKPTIKQPLKVADPDGWIPHDGGPCPVDGRAIVRVRFRAGHEETCRAAQKYWDASPAPSFQITAYKLATPPEAPKEVAAEAELDYSKFRQFPAATRGAFATELRYQKYRQFVGLPVEWDKVPAGSKVWVRDEDDEKWSIARFSCPSQTIGIVRAVRDITGSETWWHQCKLHIEGVEP